MPATPATTLAHYAHRLPIPTRWLDNDVYGHVNNVVFYAYFDTVINEYLIRAGGLDLQEGAAIGLCVESQCRYFAPARFPEPLVAGLRVAHLGRSSVRYEIGIFREGESRPLAEGHFVHVFVERTARRPTSIPASIRAALQALVTG
ncbi:MAG: acyl-CoA thioesterase [Pirellulales bacterium]|nr:acyl-CoA thioesterase [Pirellulales bacterium]